MPLKVGHHRPASETPLNAGLVAVIFRGSGSILLGNPIFL